MQFIDQMGNRIDFAQFPKRIISLVPSQTELLFDLGLDHEIVGITRYCIHPKEKCKSKVKIGGTKKFKFEQIDELEPDLIIGNKEENYPQGIERLQAKYPVWMSDVITLEDALVMITSIGQIVDRSEIAETIVIDIQNQMNQLQFKRQFSVAYFIWKNPYMVAGGETFINTMLQMSGFANIFKNDERYPEIRLDQLAEAELLLLSSEPYPFKEKDRAELQKLFPHKTILLVDGSIFSWYGSRLRYAPDYIKELRRRIS